MSSCTYFVVESNWLVLPTSSILKVSSSLEHVVWFSAQYDIHQLFFATELSELEFVNWFQKFSADSELNNFRSLIKTKKIRKYITCKALRLVNSSPLECSIWELRLRFSAFQNGLLEGNLLPGFRFADRSPLPILIDQFNYLVKSSSESKSPFLKYNKIQ